MRWVRDGETVSGNGELLVFDGIGAGHGRLICRIVGFHQASVTVVDRAIELLIGRAEADQTPVCLTVKNGIVLWNDGRE